MRKIKLIKQLIFLSCFLLFNKNFFGQTVSGKLQFEQGKMLNIQMEIKSSVAQQPGGKVMVIRPDKIEPVKTDDRSAIVFNMLKGLTDVIYPPKKGEASFFKILPDKATNKGETWTDSGQNENGKFSTEYTLTDITDSTIVVDFKGTALITTKGTMMGMETSTTLNSMNTGKIILDKITGLIKEKTTTIESNGN